MEDVLEGVEFESREVRLQTLEERELEVTECRVWNAKGGVLGGGGWSLGKGEGLSGGERSRRHRGCRR